MSKDNQIIADFMCNQYTNFGGKTERYKWQLVKDGSWYEEKDLQYDKSYDWLMPVISKINKIYEDLYKNAFVTKIPISYDIDTTFGDVICRHVTTDLNHLYERVVEFIKWYNKSKL